MILVTGAAGKTGRAVIRALITAGEQVRALVHRPDQAQLVEALGAQETIIGDARSQDTLDEATRGVRAVYHIPPNVSPDEVMIGETAVAAARSAGAEHFVYHSVLHPQAEEMPHHWSKLRVEERLFQSGLPYTILQPAAYMQNILAHWDQIMEQGVYPVPYAVETRLGMVDLEDVAEAAVTVVTEPGGHAGATYELSGTEALLQTEISAILSQEIGRPVRARVVSRKDWEQRARASGLEDYGVDALTKMFRYYERYGFWGNPRVLGWLLGRPPTSLAAFVRRTSEERSEQRSRSE